MAQNHFHILQGVISSNCIPRTNVHGGYHGLVVVTPRPHPRPQTFHRSHENLKNPYRIDYIFYM